MDQDLPARLLHQHRVVGGGCDPLRIGGESLAQRLCPEDLRGLGRPQVIAADGLSDKPKTGRQASSLSAAE
jgi:hypothetical protein